MYLKLITLFGDVYKYYINLCDLKFVFFLNWKEYFYIVLDRICKYKLKRGVLKYLYSSQQVQI